MEQTEMWKADAEAAVDRATGLALQADAAVAVVELAQVPEGILAGAEAAFRRGMLARFGTGGAAASLPPDASLKLEDPWVLELSSAFVTYWHKVLTKRAALSEAQAELRQRVGALLGRLLASDEALDEAEAEIQTELGRRGWHALLGVTAPLRELMLWRRQSTEQVEVELPEGKYTVSVHYLEDFALRGWGHYATCGRRSAGGWATQEGLFAVVPAYTSMTDETFTLRFLGHEAQHFADQQAWPELEDWELEYRAKLAELALARTIQADTLKRFCENQSERTKESPHAFANWLIVRNLEERLGGRMDVCAGQAEADAVRAAAGDLLAEDTRRRKDERG